MPEPPGMVVRSRLALSPEDAERVRVTVPVNPLRGLMVIVDVPWVPALRGPIVVGLALIMKSGEGGDWTMNLPSIGPLCMKHQ